MADDQYDLLFRYLRRYCHGNRGKNGANLPTHALIALSFRYGMGYRYERVNSVNNASKSCEDFVKFDPVTSELRGLICKRKIRHGQKTSAFIRISLDILDLFSQSFHHMKALCVQMMDLYSFSNFSRDVAMLLTADQQ